MPLASQPLFYMTIFILYSSIIVLDVISIPVIIVYSLRKIQNLVNPLVNKSYSVISVTILRILVAQFFLIAV